MSSLRAKAKLKQFLEDYEKTITRHNIFVHNGNSLTIWILWWKILLPWQVFSGVIVFITIRIKWTIYSFLYWKHFPYNTLIDRIGVTLRKFALREKKIKIFGFNINLTIVLYCLEKQTPFPWTVLLGCVSINLELF
jgi:hypothetical protein